jgi:hypothetical protein
MVVYMLIEKQLKIAYGSLVMPFTAKQMKIFNIVCTFITDVYETLKLINFFRV